MVHLLLYHRYKNWTGVVVVVVSERTFRCNCKISMKTGKGNCTESKVCPTVFIEDDEVAVVGLVTGEGVAHVVPARSGPKRRAIARTSERDELQRQKRRIGGFVVGSQAFLTSSAFAKRRGAHATSTRVVIVCDGL